ncbi:MAG: hypothetical protein AAF531_13990 [Actinomycetota bacterium]
MTSIADLLYPGSDDAGNLNQLTVALGATTLPIHGLLVGPFATPLIEVASVLSRLLKAPVGNIAIKGWGKHREVQKAIEASKKEPGEPRTVRLAQHSIKSKQSPTVEATAGGVTKTILELDLVVELELASVELVILDGEIDDAVTGGTLAKAKLSASGVTLAEHELQPADLRRQPSEPAVPAAAT